MPHTAGKIEAISIKEMNQPDRFNNTHRANIKIGDDWYSYGAIKKPEINVKDGSGWEQVTKGMDVEFMYDVNGDFKNVQKKSFTIKNKEGAQAPQQAQQQSKPNNNNSFVNPAALGNAGNYLMHTLEFSHEDMMDDAKVLEGLVKYHRSRQQLAKFWDKAEKSAQSTEKPSSKQEEEPPFDVDDDEI